MSNALPPCNIRFLLDTFQDHAADIVEVEDDIGQLKEGDTAAGVLTDALGQLLNILLTIEQDAADGIKPMDTHDINELGNYGLSLLNQLASRAQDLELKQKSMVLQDLCFPFAVWVARQGGELHFLDPIIDSLARLANNLESVDALEDLNAQMGEVIEAISPAIRQDIDNNNPMRPWRIILINHAIVATRSHNTLLMERSFDNLIMHLPEDADNFFREGMEQMEALNYPEHVREVMQRYFENWATERTLH